MVSFGPKFLIACFFWEMIFGDEFLIGDVNNPLTYHG